MENTNKIKNIIDFLGLKFYITQYKSGRKFYGGTWYLIWNWLPMNIFWSDIKIKSCGGRVIEKEYYEK